MGYSKNFHEMEIDRKKRFARNYLRDNFNAKQKKERNDVMEIIFEQIEVCEDLRCPVSEIMIRDWINNENITYIQQKARSLKFA